MSVKTWTLPPGLPIVDRRPSKAQISGLLIVGCLIGLLLAWGVSSYAESQHRPDPLNESGPWVALVPGAGGQVGVSTFDGDRGTLSTTCGQFPFSYAQSGTALAFTALPPAPKSCTGAAARTHDWFVGQLGEVASFAPAEFWRVSDSPTITLLDVSGQPLLTLTIDPTVR